MTARDDVLAHLRAGDHRSAREATRRALETDAATPEDLAAAVAEFVDERILAGDVTHADDALWQLVHDGVRPHVIVRAIQHQTVRRKGLAG